MPWTTPPNHFPRPRVGAKTRLGRAGTVYTVTGASLNGHDVLLTRDSDGKTCRVRRVGPRLRDIPPELGPADCCPIYRTKGGQDVQFYVGLTVQQRVAEARARARERERPDGSPCMMGCGRPGVIPTHTGARICRPCMRGADRENRQIGRAAGG